MKKAIVREKAAARNAKAVENGLLKLFHGIPLGVKISEFSQKQQESLKSSKAGYRQVMLATWRIAT